MCVNFLFLEIEEKYYCTFANRLTLLKNKLEFFLTKRILVNFMCEKRSYTHCDLDTFFKLVHKLVINLTNSQVQLQFMNKIEKNI